MATEENTGVQWKTVSEEGSEEETKIVFDSMGDSFVGKFLGTRQIDNADGNYTQARFEANGEVYFTNLGYSLRRGLSNVRVGSLVRVTWTDEQDTGQASPMRIFRVEVGSAPRGATAGKSASSLNT